MRIYSYTIVYVKLRKKLSYHCYLDVFKDYLCAFCIVGIFVLNIHCDFTIVHV